jgi:hypothetical protein
MRLPLFSEAMSILYIALLNIFLFFFRPSLKISRTIVNPHSFQYPSRFSYSSPFFHKNVNVCLSTLAAEPKAEPQNITATT